METKKKFSLEEFSEFTGFFRTIRFYQQGPYITVIHDGDIRASQIRGSAYFDI